MKLTCKVIPLCAAAGMGASLLVCGCLSQVRVYDIQSSHRSALHALHAETLAATMDDINKNYRKAHRLPIRVLHDRNFRVLGDSADGIADGADELRGLANLDGLTPADRAVFEGLAERLKINAENLKRAAADKDRAAARAAFARLTSTCNSCHAAFRESTSQSHHGGS